MTETDLGSFPVHTVHQDRVLYRIHRATNDPIVFSQSGQHRFDLTDEAEIGTCYCALSELGAFVETFRRIRHIPQHVVDERALSSLSLSRPLKLADLTDRSIIGSFGIAGDVSTGTDYAASQQLGARLYEAGFDGVFYAARHDPSFTERSVAVFGNDESGEKLLEVITEPISSDLVEEACSEFGFSVLPATPLQ